MPEPDFETGLQITLEKGHGDLYAVVHINMPISLTDAQRKYF